MSLPKISVDFNNLDTQGRVRLNTNGAMRDIQKLIPSIKDDMKVFLDDEDLKAIGYLKFSVEENIWVADFNSEYL
ncbi:MAG TPA: hypothetical protein VK484_01530 [Ferruginibacter sp.]|nr:hypothetical protein [Ferruginibacter sp.]